MRAEDIDLSVLDEGKIENLKESIIRSDLASLAKGWINLKTCSGGRPNPEGYVCRRGCGSTGDESVCRYPLELLVREHIAKVGVEHYMPNVKPEPAIEPETVDVDLELAFCAAVDDAKRADPKTPFRYPRDRDSWIARVEFLKRENGLSRVKVTRVKVSGVKPHAPGFYMDSSDAHGDRHQSLFRLTGAGEVILVDHVRGFTAFEGHWGPFLETQAGLRAFETQALAHELKRRGFVVTEA